MKPTKPLAEQAASVMLALILGVLFALAIVHWIDLEGITSQEAAPQVQP